MSPRSFGLVGPGRINNPLGKTGLYVTLSTIIVVALYLLDVDPDVIAYVIGGEAVIGAAGAEKIRRQPPEYRDPNDE